MVRRIICDENDDVRNIFQTKVQLSVCHSVCLVCSARTTYLLCRYTVCEALRHDDDEIGVYS
jgi:hypothetical protein